MNQRSLEILSEIALTFTRSDNIDTQMNTILRKIGEYIHVSRIYIFLDSKDGSATSNVYEWCNEGIEPQIGLLQGIPYEIIPSWKKFLHEDGRVYSENISDLPADARAVLEPQNIISIVVYPLYTGNKISGFIGFDECKIVRKWQEEELILLKTLSGIISTVLEREHIQQQFRTGKENFETFFNTIDDLMIIGDKDGRIIYVNEALIRKMEYSCEELMKMKIEDLHPEALRPEAARILESMIKGEFDTCPLQVITRSGKTIPVNTRVWLGNWDGQEAIFGISKDLTKEQEALQKFTSLFMNNPAPMAISSLSDHKFTDVNTSFLSKTGYSRQEVIGKTAEELNLFVDADRQNQVASLLRMFGFIKDVELEVRCKDGSVITGLFHGEIIENQGEKFFLTVMVDITEQNALHKLTSKQKLYLENIIVGTHVGTWEWNIKTGVTHLNERWAGIIGYTKEELGPTDIGSWVKYTHPDDLAKSNELLKYHFEGKAEFYECECRMKHKNGDWIWVLDRGKVIVWDDLGNPEVMYGTHLDISEKKKAEQKIQDFNTKIVSELEFSARIQKNIVIPELVVGKHYRVNSAYFPCEELGGDYHDFFDHGDHLYLISADFSGHGLIPSFFTFMLKGIIKTVMSTTSSFTISCDQLMSVIYKEMKSYLVMDYFFTVNVIMIDTVKNTLHFTNAANPPFFIFGSRGVKTVSKMSRMITGSLPPCWEEEKLPLLPDEKVLIVSDGLLEARSPDGKLLGADRINRLLLRNHNKDPREIIELLLKKGRDWQKSEKFRDDVTICIFEGK
jgi:PAS domain S-box-containing protein